MGKMPKIPMTESLSYVNTEITGNKVLEASALLPSFQCPLFLTKIYDIGRGNNKQKFYEHQNIIFKDFIDFFLIFINFMGNLVLIFTNSFLLDF